jgi:hypothetical protein
VNHDEFLTNILRNDRHHEIDKNRRFGSIIMPTGDQEDANAPPISCQALAKLLPIKPFNFHISAFSILEITHALSSLHLFDVSSSPGWSTHSIQCNWWSLGKWCFNARLVVFTQYLF